MKIWLRTYADGRIGLVTPNGGGYSGALFPAHRSYEPRSKAIPYHWMETVEAAQERVDAEAGAGHDPSQWMDSAFLP